MADTFTPPKPPSVSSYSSNQKPAVNRTEFGDGYSQRSPEGINNQPRVLQLSLKSLTVIERDTVLAFFQSHGGITPFLYTPPQDATEILWSCGKWQDRPAKNKTHWDVNFTLRQEYDLNA